MLIRQHPQGIDLSRCANQVAEIFIIHIQERRIDVAGDGIETHNVPLCFLAIDLDGQPVADLQVGEYVEEVIADHDGILVTCLQPAPLRNDRIDQGGCGGRRNEYDLCPCRLLVPDQRARVLAPAFHTRNARNTFGDGGDLLIAVIAAEGHIDVRKEVPLDVFDHLVEGCP